MTPSVRIELLGREYVLRTQESEEQVRKVVTFVEARLEEMSAGTSVDTRDLTVLTLLNLAGQYLQLAAECERQQADGERLEGLVALIENHIHDNSGCLTCTITV